MFFLIYVFIHNVHTGWRKPMGCLELQIILGKRATNYRALLREMTCKDKASYESTPPCNETVYIMWTNVNCGVRVLRLVVACPISGPTLATCDANESVVDCICIYISYACTNNWWHQGLGTCSCVSYSCPYLRVMSHMSISYDTLYIFIYTHNSACVWERKIER